jgi:hypothetical protein
MEVHNAFDFLNWLQAELSGPEVTCRRAGFRRDGTLQLGFSSKDGRCTLRWGRIRGRRVIRIPGMDDAFLPLKGTSRARAKVVLERIAPRLKKIVQHHNPEPLRHGDPEPQDIVFDRAVVERLFGSLIQVGLTRYGPYRCARIDWYPGAPIEITFESALRTLRFGLVPADIFRGARPNVIASTGALILCRILDDRDGREKRTREHQVDQYLGFLFNRRVPDKLRLVEYRDSIPLGSTYQWGSDLACQFFCEKEHDCISLMNAMFAARGRAGLVAHIDRECLNTFAMFPRRLDTYAVSRWYTAPRPEFLDRLFSTDISADGAVLGAGSAVEEILAGGAAPRLSDFGFIWHSCLSLMIGDSVQPEILGAIEMGDSKFECIRCEMDVRNRYASLQKLWLLLLTQARRRVPANDAVDTASVNLIGYGNRGDPALAELTGRLEMLGVSTRACLVPSFDAGELGGFFRAAANLVMPEELTIRAFAEATRLCEAPTYHAPAPFGLAGTRAWLMAIGRIFSREEPAQELFNAWFGEYRERWQEIRERAGRHRVALVLGVEQIPYAFNPYYNFGVPILACLEEMGFGVDLLVYDQLTSHDALLGRREPVTILSKTKDVPGWKLTRRKLRSPRQDLDKLLDSAPPRRVMCFSSDEDLARLLKEGTFDLVYSEIYRDRRVTSAGKIPFDLRAFEPGLRGAENTARKLLKLCDTPFYRVYRDYLGEP